MKIVQVIPAFVIGGAETMCANLSIELASMGHDVTVVSLYDFRSAITDRLEENGIKTVYLRKKPGFRPSVIGKLKKIFKEIRPDAVHSHLHIVKYVFIAARLAGVRVKVHTIHSVAGHSDSRFGIFVNRIIFRIFHVIPVSLSEDVRQTVVRAYGIKPDKSPVVYNGVPLERCKRVSGYPERAVNFIHVGRFSEAKNHAELIRGFADAHKTVPDIVLSLYGDGRLKDDAEDLVKALGAEDFIKFCGVTDDVFTVMSKADVFILPSLVEGMPMTIIEAMGTGLPIIASAVGGIPDMITDGVNGLLIGTDAASVSGSVKALADNRALRERLGTNALKRSEDFSARKMALNYLEIYQSTEKNK